jgi:hypothetical protein
MAKGKCLTAWPDRVSKVSTGQFMARQQNLILEAVSWNSRLLLTRYLRRQMYMSPPWKTQLLVMEEPTTPK